jgi:hypothetical protein
MILPDVLPEDEARELIRQGKIPEALASYDRALSRDPDNALLLSSKAVALISLGRFEDARVHADHAANLNPGSAEIWITHAEALERLNRLDESAESLERAVTIEPDNVYAHALLGIVYRKLNLEDRAEDQDRLLQKLVFPTEYAGFLFALAAFLLGMLAGGIYSFEGKSFETGVASEVAIIILFCFLCGLFFRSQRKGDKIRRTAIRAAPSLPMTEGRDVRVLYSIVGIMVLVFCLGIVSGNNIWTWMG